MLHSDFLSYSLLEFLANGDWQKAVRKMLVKLTPAAGTKFSKIKNKNQI